MANEGRFEGNGTSNVKKSACISPYINIWKFNKEILLFHLATVTADNQT